MNENTQEDFSQEEKNPENEQSIQTELTQPDLETPIRRDKSQKQSDEVSNGLGAPPQKIIDICAECARGNFKPYVFALDKGFLRNPMQADQAGYSVIHQAIAYGDLALVRVLVEKYGQSPNFIAETNQTPLMIALNYCHRPIIRYLCKYNPSINHMDNTKFSPLMYTVKQMDWLSFFYILSKGANLETADINGCTLAHWAAFKNDPFLVQVLTRLGSDMAMKDHSGLTPFQRAHSSACFISMKALLDLSFPKYQTSMYLKNDKLVSNNDFLPDAHKLEECSNVNCGPWMKKEIMKKQRRKAGTNKKASKATILSGDFFKEAYEDLCLKNKWTPFYALIAIVGTLWLVYVLASKHSHDLYSTLFSHIVLFHYVICAAYFVSKEELGFKIKARKQGAQSALNQQETSDIEMSPMVSNSSSCSKIFAILQQSCYYIPFQEYHNYLQHHKMANYFFETVVDNYENAGWLELLETHQRSLCPLCLIWKPQRTRHCKRMNVCVRNYRTFSSFFNKLVTNSNYLFYLLLHIFQLILLWSFSSLLQELNPNYHTWVFAKVELVVFFVKNWHFLYLGTYLFSLGMFYCSLVRVLVEIYCICKNLTYDELYNRKHYPYLYAKSTDKRGTFYLKWSNPNDQGIYKNILSFFKSMASN